MYVFLIDHFLRELKPIFRSLQRDAKSYARLDELFSNAAYWQLDTIGGASRDRAPLVTSQHRQIIGVATIVTKR
jgi:pyruvate-formate lyase